jgi:hypothetical protein
MVVVPSATVEDGNTEEIRGGSAPVTDHLPDFSLVIDRVCILLLSALVVFVPALTGGETQSYLLIISNVIVGVTCVLPTTMCVLKADGSAHTKWFWWEILTFLGAPMAFVLPTFEEYDVPNLSRWYAYIVFAVSIAGPCTRAACRRHRAPGDRQRVTLLLLVGLCQVFFALGDFMSEDVRISSMWSIGVLACSACVAVIFWLDRDKDIEHSVPYAVAYAWTLNASVLGASYIIGLFYQYDTLISSVFGQSSLLVTQVALTLFSTLVLWMFEQVSASVTTADDHRTFIFPGLFAVVN